VARPGSPTRRSDGQADDSAVEFVVVGCVVGCVVVVERQIGIEIGIQIGIELRIEIDGRVVEWRRHHRRRTAIGLEIVEDRLDVEIGPTLQSPSFLVPTMPTLLHTALPVMVAEWLSIAMATTVVMSLPARPGR